jgi:hypothetical protein
MREKVLDGRDIKFIVLFINTRTATETHRRSRPAVLSAAIGTNQVRKDLVMGGFFSSPSVASVAPLPAPPPPPDPTAAATQERLDAIERNRRGLYGTIATSDKGLLQPAAATQGKSLLGE